MSTHLVGRVTCIPQNKRSPTFLHLHPPSTLSIDLSHLPPLVRLLILPKIPSIGALPGRYHATCTRRRWHARIFHATSPTYYSPRYSYGIVDILRLDVSAAPPVQPSFSTPSPRRRRSPADCGRASPIFQVASSLFIHILWAITPRNHPNRRASGGTASGALVYGILGGATRLSKNLGFERTAIGNLAVPARDPTIGRSRLVGTYYTLPWVPQLSKVPNY